MGIFPGLSQSFLSRDTLTCGKRNMNIAQKAHNKLVDKRYAEDSECFREAFRESIYKRVVVKGMWPAEAFLAGGGGIYRVKADPKKWERGANPMLVMKAQCTDPR